MKKKQLLQKGDWAVITGASSGIGKAIAERLAQRGVNLFIVALDQNTLSELAKMWKEKYLIQTVAMPLDLSGPQSAEKIFEQLREHKISVTLLLNAAGFGYFGDFEAMPTQQIYQIIQVNVTTVVQLCRLAYVHMRGRKRGIIINIASVAGHLPYPFAAVYCGGKSFIHLFTRALWAENQTKNIKIISLCPGYTKTNFEIAAKEPSGIHLFKGEDPYDIADTLLRHIDRNECTLFTKFSHPFKILAAKLLPLKLFTSILRYLRKK